MPDADPRVAAAERYIRDLEDAIQTMCTEMPIGWTEMFTAEGRKNVVDVVCWAVDREGDYQLVYDGSPADG